MTALGTWLDGLATHHEAEDRWGEIRLLGRTYLTDRAPPAELVSSVRAVVLKGRSVAVIQDGHGSGHVVPGGRIEAGESWDETLRRELLEECGWRVGETRQFAVLHFRHLTPKPDGYRYIHPDFLQPVFVAEAISYHRGAVKRAGEIELGSRMTPIRQALARLEGSQQMLLTAALAARA